MLNMEEGMDASDDRRNSAVSNANSIVTTSSTVKEIQVTAKEIVDRISSHSTGMESSGAFDEKQGKPTGYVKPFTGGMEQTEEKAEDLSSDVKGKGTGEIAPAPQERTGRMSTKMSRFSVSSMTSENGSGSVTIEQRAVEHLLDVVQVSITIIIRNIS